MELQTNIQPLTQFSNKASKLEKVGKDFEAMFMFQVIELMQPPVDKDNPFSGGTGEEMFRPILNEHISNAMAKRGGMGISESVEKQIEKYREFAR